MVDDPCQNNEYGNVKMLHVQTSAVKFSQYTVVKYNISQQLFRGRALVDTTENTWQHKSLAISFIHQYNVHSMYTNPVNTDTAVAEPKQLGFTPKVFRL